MLGKIVSTFKGFSKVNRGITMAALAAVLFFVSLKACADGSHIKYVEHHTACAVLATMAQDKAAADKHHTLLRAVPRLDDYRTVMAYTAGKVEGVIIGVSTASKVSTVTNAKAGYENWCKNTEA